MTDQLTVSLDDLKRAIDACQTPLEQPYPSETARRMHHEERACAWRTAFEWRETFLRRAVSSLESEEALARWHAERDEGMRLIREKLR